MLDQLMQKAERLAEEFVAELMTRVDPASMNIDPRAAYELWRCADAIAIRKHQRGSFDYYAGGQYVNREYVFEVGDYVFYAAEDPRVAAWLGIATDDEEEVDPLDDFNYVGSRHHY